MSAQQIQAGAQPIGDGSYALDDRYAKDAGRVYLNGTQALVRLLLVQHRRDKLAGLNTAGYISGYRGSPVGNVDVALWNAAKQLAAHQVRFEPGLNEDLAATSIWGTQQASLLQPIHDGVFALWYGKGPGVDRSCDALKHGNYSGTSRHGGVLVVAGDDHAAKSSSLPHQSDPALIHCGIPILSPASLQDILDMGVLGWAMSRYSGAWVGFKCVTDLLDSSGSVDASIDRVKLIDPDGERASDAAADRWIKWNTLPLLQERRLWEDRLPAVHRFARANGIDRVVFGANKPRLGIVTAGKAYGDVRHALDRLGIDAVEAERIGLAVYKLGLVWPIEPEGLRRFAGGLESLLVVEEKRPLIEDQIAVQLFAEPLRPRLQGKRDAAGAGLLPLDGELNVERVTDAVARWLGRSLPAKTEVRPAVSASLVRLAAFCAGCPHNQSTKVPEGSQALAGIGCHGMVLAIPERRTLAYTHMGAEGSNWIGLGPFSHERHIFQNLGDGTYSHSGSLAIRAAVAAKANITYKILVNGAVAMTGGQPIEGHPAVDVAGLTEDIAGQLLAEGVRRIAVVTDYPEALAAVRLPAGVKVHHRDELDSVQRALRNVEGVTAIIYDQACAAEKRRLRKRGLMDDPARRLFINEAVCEGCGDCSVQSNCIAVEPVDTEFGRKRAINQDACNKDYSCLDGYCPSFAVLDGAKLKRRSVQERGLGALLDKLPPPEECLTDGPRRILVAGIGGTGVVTIGALLGMAAHLSGKVCNVLDQTGVAQKNGAVTSHVQIGHGSEQIHAARIGEGEADLVIACDLVTAATVGPLSCMSAGRTKVVANRDVAPTAQFARDRDLDLAASPLESAIVARVGTDAAHFVAATSLARQMMGDDLAVNLMLLGFALQRGWIGLPVADMERAIELNGVKVEFNQRSLALGRLIAHDAAAVKFAIGNHAAPLEGEESKSRDYWEALAERRSAFLAEYQDTAYAERYSAFVKRVAQREAQVAGAAGALALAVAQGYSRVLACKDEYEVARLWTDPRVRAKLDDLFEPGYALRLSLAPQLPGLEGPRGTRSRKRLWGPWALVLFRGLAAMRTIRGTWLDVFGYHPHRRRERALIGDYEATIQDLLATLTPANRALAVDIARLPDSIRGYGVVKDRSIEEANVRRKELLARYRDTPAEGVSRRAAA